MMRDLVMALVGLGLFFGFLCMALPVQRTHYTVSVAP